MAAKEKDKAKQAGAGGFFKGVRTEFGKIIWPGRDTMVKQLIAVIDFGAQNLIDVLVKINA